MQIRVARGIGRKVIKLPLSDSELRLIQRRV